MTRHTPLLTILLTLALCGVAVACPLCKDAIPSNDAQAPGALPGGFNLSIYYMLGGLFAVISGFGFFVVRTIRQTDALHTRRGFPVTAASELPRSTQ
jgi:hypothetical protein